MNTSHIPLTGIASLSEAELFAICAARVYRESREHSAPHCTCLQHIFVAARMSVALPKFLEMQIVLGVDSKQTLAYEERSAQLVGSGEIALLRALSTWQHDLASDPTSALWFVRVRAIRRIASDAGRSFALQMAGAGLVLPDMRAYSTPTTPLIFDATRTQDARHVH